MLISLTGQFAYLALTKTGSTSIENAIRPRCQVLFTRDSRVTHMPAHQFERFVRPYLQHCGLPEVDTVCQLRHPISWLESWWRYRSKPAVDERATSTRGVSFETFAGEYIDGVEQPYLGMHRPLGFICDDAGEVMVDLVYRFEDMRVFVEFLEHRTGSPVNLNRDNRSARRWTRLSKPMRLRLEEFFAPELAIWENRTARSATARGRSANAGGCGTSSTPAQTTPPPGGAPGQST